MARFLKIAIVQKTAFYLELEDSVSLAIDLIENCSSNGAKLIVLENVGSLDIRPG